MLERGNMAKKKEGVSRRLDLTSKFWRTFLTVLAALLSFAGPTYVVYVLANVLKIDYFRSMLSGIVLFVVGLVLVWYLLRKEIIS